jgi:glycolate oxidase
MNRIKEINFADAVAVVEPGVITADLQEKAREERLFYPPDPASQKDCTIGGNVATNAGGPRCLKYGVTRNYVIGLEVVLANGDVLRTGGRVHKNKTGFNLVGLFVGSEGMLGVVTEITVRLLPLPPARATLSAAFATMKEAAATVQAIFQAGFLPASLEIADHFTLEAARRDRGSAHVPAGNAHMLVELMVR